MMYHVNLLDNQFSNKHNCLCQSLWLYQVKKLKGYTGSASNTHFHRKIPPFALPGLFYFNKVNLLYNGRRHHHLHDLLSTPGIWH